MIDLCLLGTGGMMPLPYRYLTSLVLRYNGKTILLDCGEGTQIAMKRRGWSPNPIGVILFTHYHADHIAGLPGMLLSMGNADRTEPVLLAGPKGLQKVVDSLRIIAPELPFEIVYHEIDGPEETFDLPGEKDFHIRAYKVNHRVPCYCYRFDLDRAGRFDVERAKTGNVPLSIWNTLQKGESVTVDGKLYTPDMVMGPPRKGLSVAYATDSRPCDNIVRAATGTDLFICEGMYADEDKLSKAKEKKHMTFCEAARIAAKAQPKEMWLTHYSPSEMHPEQEAGEAKKIFPNTIAAKDGRSLSLTFSQDEGAKSNE